MLGHLLMLTPARIGPGCSQDHGILSGSFIWTARNQLLDPSSTLSLNAIYELQVERLNLNQHSEMGLLYLRGRELEKQYVPVH